MWCDVKSGRAVLELLSFFLPTGEERFRDVAFTVKQSSPKVCSQVFDVVFTVGL